MPDTSKNNRNRKKVVEIFEAALELPPEKRGAFVRRACGGNKDLQPEVEALLAADGKAREFTESPAAADASLTVFQEGFIPDAQTNTFLARKIGAFRIEREIGRGGMGAVYLAKRDDGEFEQTVAVKIIRHSFDSDFAARRFRLERQILATLEHPNIARLVDGGTTLDGLPYLVMEHITGENLLEFARLKNLSLRARIELFEQVCRAVEYAHERNILHRDIKPVNILVSRAGTVKLLDFGIAKLNDGEAEEHGQSLTGRRLMTPEYASPEQIRGEIPTPATDVYSLGVVLYELVTGTRPYKFSSRAPHEIARVVCEETVESPKSKIRNLQTEQRGFAVSETAVSDALERIIFKSLRKGARERYQTAGELAADIRRYLKNAPVTAPVCANPTD
jgi:eukaryotic-like serine/threonine-protein kinase